jgi:oxygen-independent coproporphyrinogen-3 oxidase
MAETISRQLGGEIDRKVDSIYLGGGTPSVLAPRQLERIFCALRKQFDVDPASEVTVECAPGTITDDILEALLACGVNRVSLGVQSFVDQETSSVGRLHTREVTLTDIASLRASGIGNISLDLIAGLPHQTQQSWDASIAETIATGVPHVSVYMLEVDEDSRLGNELLAGGSRYHAHYVPDDDLTADLYLAACERLESGGLQQYEISNFARPVTHGIGLRDSRHNLKYWRRQPYLGLGVDAHSMLPASHELRAQGFEAVRFSTPDSLEGYSKRFRDSDSSLDRAQDLLRSRTLVDWQAALEESFFLGLRMNRGVALADLEKQFGSDVIEEYESVIGELVGANLLTDLEGRLQLTSRGRLLSNEVFGRFIRDRKGHEGAKGTAQSNSSERKPLASAMTVADD